MMYSICFLLCVITGQILSVCSSSCLMYERCLDQLRNFTQAGEFHVYTTIKETEVACRFAKDAYTCVSDAPECMDPEEKARLSPILRGSSRLLAIFCGFSTKKRPCCALRTAYLDHSRCFWDIRDRLKDCNDKYRKSLEMILELEDMTEQNEQRYCSLRWFDNCVKRATQSYCGKIAAQVLRTYVVKAGQPHKAFIERKDQCSKTPYGYEQMSDEICQPKRFEDCRVLFIPRNPMRSDKDIFMSFCTDIHSFAFECLNRIYKRCLFSRQHGKFEEILQIADKKDKQNACFLKESNDFSYAPRGFYRHIHCLAEYSPSFYKCKDVFESPANYTSHTMPQQDYNNHFCSLNTKLKECLLESANDLCGLAGIQMMDYITGMASANNRWKCTQQHQPPLLV